MASHIELLEIAATVARRAGAFAVDRRSHGVSVAETKSSPIDIVTQVDRDTETFIRSALAEYRPADGFFGEEGDADAGSSGLTWVVDPIDGTVNFLYDIPAWAVSVAVVEGDVDPATWNVLAGAVMNPVTGEVYTAAAGEGAWLGDRPLRVNDGVRLDRALVATGFSYLRERKERQGRVVAGLVPRIRDLRRIGSAALDLSTVGSGRLDAFYEAGLNPWDHAAGGLVAREAGARMGGLGGAPAGADMLIAAPPSLFDDLARAIDELWEA
ncbi:inositol monophosphatase family protein [Agromyces sp. SYSU T00194]|uniref:inositol monophosphatase family protein n=1 Tax=Agromyces chitinivorans TaxID=3158560 RepID=UPI0033982F83